MRGIEAAIGHPMLIAHELERRILVPVFDSQAEAPERCCLITTAPARQRSEVQAFREWVLREAEAAGRTGADPVPAQPCDPAPVNRGRSRRCRNGCHGRLGRAVGERYGPEGALDKTKR